MDTNLRESIQKMVESAPVFLFMKGNPTFPQCGFSNQVVQILKAYDIPFDHCNVLEDMDIRQGIKEFSDWPTIPQLYIQGEFVGGCDIVRESWESGELTDWLREAFPGRDIAAPSPPAKPQNITPEQASAMVNQEGVKLLDVRTQQEREIAVVDGFAMLDQELAQEILDSWNKETPMVFMCHFGGRSAQACQFFADNGFQKVYNVEGGIDAWSQTVDPSIARY
ncbi:Grx4 family monothiol glutaredoxin [Sulfidibacter corallicola]|uniref:Probable monothiol glutaredoxin 2 n=1 Tax=Sulfidibacter corallicola TaxID=2818388 RepID=A0A8A4TVY5_SULCO|nr:Grx4 family monothiol glutaredoxin [Sulfidibacter corallicola]QTD54126.1 Grx4 family monothiol glutaredoxin [Sulfidibacter corallicola]